jgi:alkylation response protein AidB-like acyl-CoA dehydrogenase
VLAEEMQRYGIPQALQFITIQIVGAFVLAVGTESQKRRLLPPMARGEQFACVLFTEPEVGSDLAALTTTATPSDDGWLVNGCKMFNSKSSYTDVGLCAVRTDAAVSRYEGLSLLLVPMRAPGVRIRMIPSLTREAFHVVELENVRVSNDALVGAPGQGWWLVSTLLANERSGLDYYARGMQWLASAREELQRTPADADTSTLEGLGRHWARLEAGRWLALRVLQRLAEGHPDVTQASQAKWYCSEVAQQAGWWVVETLDPLATVWDERTVTANLHQACREAPSLTISGGTSEVLLETVAGARLDRLGVEAE